jgi:hypothetical protein
MRVEWAVGCRGANESARGRFDVVEVGLNGFDLTGEVLPYRVRVLLLVCFQADAGDEHGAFYDFEIEPVGPDGAQPPTNFQVQQRADAGPQLQDPERYHLPTPMEFTVTSPGNYRLRLADATGERYVVPFRFVALPDI